MQFIFVQSRWNGYIGVGMLSCNSAQNLYAGYRFGNRMESKAKELIELDIFSRRVSPYFTWLESKIESGWSQSENVEANVLKEAKYLAESMRARFILGLNREEFMEEIRRTLELFELALDAFPDFASEIETKVQHFTKGLRTEFGEDVIPNGRVEAKKPKVKKPAKKVKNGVKAEKPKVKKAAKKSKKVKKETKVKKESAGKAVTDKDRDGTDMTSADKAMNDEKSAVVEPKADAREYSKAVPQTKNESGESSDGPIARFFKRLIWGEE